MRLNIKYLIPTLFVIFNQIIQSESQNLESPQTNQTSQNQNAQPVQSAQNNQVTDEQLDSFSYGSEEFKLAIIGDSGAERESREVMKLTSFDALLHLGDYDYECTTNKYFDKILDSDRSYQFMGILGNHEGVSECGQDKFNKYKSIIHSEMTGSKNSKINCEFSSSKAMWVCIYKNMRIIGLSPAINGADSREEQLAFLKKHLDGATEDWKVCSWHFYDKYYHTGKYHSDSERNVVSGSGESFYDYCKSHGAIILSAHDHVYARTQVMSEFKSPVIDEFDKNNDGRHVQIRKGATLNILNGVGGYEMYEENGPEKDYSHWHKKYSKGTGNENAKKYGGLFCRFNYGGNNKKAYCELLRINTSEKIFDSFYIYQNENPGSVTYSQIDDNFMNEKRNAYMLANSVDMNDTNRSGNGSNDTINNIVDKVFTTKNIIIGGSVCAAALILGGGMFIARKPKKQTKQVIGDPELLSKVSHKDYEESYGMSFSSLQPANSYFSKLSNSNNNNNNNINNVINNNAFNNNTFNRSLYEDSFTPLPTPDLISPLTMTTEKSAFSPLPMPEGLSFYGTNRNSKSDFSFFDKSFTNRDDLSSYSYSTGRRTDTIGGDSNSDAYSLINHRYGNNGRGSVHSTRSNNSAGSFNVKYSHVNNNNIRFNSFARPNGNNSNNNNNNNNNNKKN